MTASFSLSIILFLCFSVGLDFARELVPSLRSWQPDITLNGYANALLLEPDLLNEIQEIPHVKMPMVLHTSKMSLPHPPEKGSTMLISCLIQTICWIAQQIA